MTGTQLQCISFTSGKNRCVEYFCAMSSDVLSPEEYRFVNLLLDGCSVAQASEAVGICRRSGYLWREKPHIKAALAAGQEGRVKIFEEIKMQQIAPVAGEAADMLKKAVPLVLQRLIDLTDPDNASAAVRVTACKEVLKLAGITELTTHREVTEQQIGKHGLSSEEADEIRRKILGLPTNE